MNKRYNFHTDSKNVEYAKVVIRGYEILIDYDDLDIVYSHGWNIDKIAANKKKLFYFTAERVINGQRTKIRLHREIMKCERKDGKYIDHINGNTLDNRKCNLRICSNAENARSRKVRKDSSSGYRGITFYKQTKRWVAYIGINYKKINLGYYSTIEEAIEARKIAVKKYHGDFARYN